MAEQTKVELEDYSKAKIAFLAFHNFLEKTTNPEYKKDIYQDKDQYLKLFGDFLATVHQMGYPARTTDISYRKAKKD